MNGNGEILHTRYTCTEEMSFHAVYVPQENPDSENKGNGNIRVYLDKTEALKAIKEHKTGRLKTFKTRSDAEQYAKFGYEPSIPVNGSSTPVATEEKPSNFKAPRPQELVRFRKLIETGDLDAVKSVVWGNPRYLISAGDTPAILKEGSRYNALHIAVIAARVDMCEFILNTVGDTSFIQLLYGEEEHKSYVNRAEVMLDLYLNTPDKGLNETPLHFAVKFGLKDIVRVLVSYSQCIKTLPNKYKDMPINIVCSRKCQNDEKLKKEICMLLGDQYYVPVLRTEDNILQPVIGEPFSPIKPLNLNADPISPRLEVRAFAGPMTKPQATEFRRKWKTPPRTCFTISTKDSHGENNTMDSHNTNLALRLQDTEKGLECVGRNLAEEYHVSWKEYWFFLKDFADFRCPNGLEKLEKYLELQFLTRFSSNKKLEAKNSSTHKLDTVHSLQELCNKLESCSLSDNSNETVDSADEEYHTPPSSPIFMKDDSDDEMYTVEEGPMIFIDGSSISKEDHDVYNAIPSSIDPHTYPYIYLWRHGVQLMLKDSTFRLSKPRITRRRLLAD